DLSRLQQRGVDGVRAALAVDPQAVVGGFGLSDLNLGRRRLHDDHAAGREHLDVVVALRPVDDDGVRGAVARAGIARQVHVDLGAPRPGQVADVDRVHAAEGRDVDPLGAGDVHDDVGHVTGEQQAAAVGRQVEALVDVGAVELQGVGPGLTLDDV